LSTSANGQGRAAPKVGAFIPIRLDSERLPGKALRDVVGRPTVHHLLDRAVACRYIRSPRDVVVCTTPEPSNDPLVEAVEAYGASVFRGDRDDLIRRFKDASSAYGFDIMVQVDGDDPLCDTQYMDLVVGALLADTALDTAVTIGLPFGINVKGFTRAALDKVFAHYTSTENDTGFALYFTRSDLCRRLEIPPVTPDHVLDEARLTLDYEQDLQVFRRIFQQLYEPGKIFGLSEVVRFLRTTPEVMEINNGLQEQYMVRSREKFDITYQDETGELCRIEL
jgi:spore coat polysaccharide biosynthesis protein SpsF